MIARTYTMEGTPVALVEHTELDASHGGSGIFAKLEVGSDVWNLSQLDGESDWHVDALFGFGWQPVWVHGFGSRVTRQTIVTDPGVVRMLEEVSHR